MKTAMTTQQGHDCPDERQALLQQQREDQHRHCGLSDVENPQVISFEDDQPYNSPNDGVPAIILERPESPSSPSQCGGSVTSSLSKNMETIVRGIKYTCSMCLLIFCIRIIVAGIIAVQTPIAKYIHWMVALTLMWILILWLGMLEGGQGSLVGLEPIDRESYASSHPIAYRCAGMAHKGDNLNRFIVGRQFLVVLVVFALNLCCSVDEDAVVPGFSPTLVEAFLESGLAVMLITVILGQLAAEVNATNCMLDFINSSLMLATTWLCLAIETSGLLHSCYLVQYIFGIFTKRETVVPEEEESNVPTKRTTTESFFFWVRVLFSLSLVAFTCAVTMSALLHGQTTMYEGLPDFANVAVFFGLICFLGMLEAMQIALFAVVNLPKEALDRHPIARANCQLAFRESNFQAFLIGRQICVTMCMFLLARITTTDVNVDEAEPTVMGMSNSLQEFFNTGLPGALVTTVVASLAWRIIASTFPVAFLANPFVYTTIRLCLLLEATGGFSAAWLCAKSLKAVIGFRLDEDYLGPLCKRDCKRDEMEKDDKDLTDVDTLSETNSETNSSYGSTMDSFCEEEG